MISTKGTTMLFAPRCPVCLSQATVRLPHLLALDCTCLHCGYHFTSALKRTVLAALSR